MTEKVVNYQGINCFKSLRKVIAFAFRAVSLICQSSGSIWWNIRKGSRHEIGPMGHPSIGGLSQDRVAARLNDAGFLYYVFYEFFASRIPVMTACPSSQDEDGFGFKHVGTLSV